MPIKPTFHAICEDVRLEIGGRVSVIGLFDTLALPAIPGGANLCVTTRWNSTGPCLATVSLYMVTPDSSSPILLINQPIELKDQDGMGFCAAGTVAKFAWQFHTPGLHYIQVRLDNEETNLLPLMIRKLPESKPPR